jgi:NADPH-dependent 2,4-dienoyl-CoA reductase/sulfur reductase-like enzyme
MSSIGLRSLARWSTRFTPAAAAARSRHSLSRSVLGSSSMLKNMNTGFSVGARGFSTEEAASIPRESMEFDVVTVGAGPAGLSAAIRLKQLAQQQGKEISVCVVEKAAEIGAHILSGNVFEPHALKELFPDWQNMDAPVATPAEHDDFLVLTEKGSMKIPHFLLPPTLHNEGNYIISLSELVRWLGKQAEELGVEIYPGFAADEVLYDEKGAVRGVSTVHMNECSLLVLISPFALRLQQKTSVSRKTAK